MKDATGQERAAAGSASAGRLHLLGCPDCGGRLARAGAERLVCASCGAETPVRDGIVDFVAGGAITALDDIDYDARYAINLGASLHLYEDIVRAAGPRWPERFGESVEIGCGTGGFSMAFLSRADVDGALLTDVSLKMLRTCRARLQRMSSLLRTERMDFATFSGTEACLAPAAFDTCYGTAVLHHIADLPLVLSRIHALLKPGGRAFFMEPALPFHRALTATAADLVATWARDGSVPEAQFVPIANWLAEIHCNVANTGDIEVLADREDKHQFVADEVEAMAMAVGFAAAESLPIGPDPTGAGTIGVYLSQLGLADATLARAREGWPSAQRRHFSQLPPRDQAPSYLFWLRKGRRRRASGPAPASSRPSLILGDVPLRMWLNMRVERDGDTAVLAVDGWCVAVEPLRAIELSIGRQVVRLPIWRARPDVLRAVNGDSLYPNLHALCSGIRGRVPLAAGSRGTLVVKVAAVGVAGGRLAIRTVTLPAGGVDETIDLSMKRAG